MTTLSIEESKLKSIFKTAILEVLDENHDMLIKNLEDSVFLTAIKENLLILFLDKKYSNFWINNGIRIQKKFY